MARQSISAVFSQLASDAPDRILASDTKGTLTARELEEHATRCAAFLISCGVRRNDLVRIMLPNTRNFLIACVAVWKAGATPQPLSPDLSDSELHELESLAPATAVLDPQTMQHASSFPSSPLPDTWASSWKAPTSSGSTGRPKIIRATAPALIDPDQQVAEFLPRRATQLVTGPLWHSAVFTYALRGLMTGQRLVILPRFEEHAWLEAVAEHHITWTLLVPTMMHRLMRLPTSRRELTDIGSLKTLVHLGAPCAPELKRRFMDWVGPQRVVEIYAGTESNGLTMIRGDQWLAHPGSVGLPISGTEIEVRDEESAPLSPGETGLVWMRRGDAATYEYLGAQSRRDLEGWDTLGDLGYLNEAGYLFLHDRADDVINCGGEKIYPAVIEQGLERHPAVRSALAYGVEHPEWGQVPEALVDIADSRITEEELISHCQENLARSSQPRRIRVVRKPLRNDAGKARRPNTTRMSLPPE